MTLEERRNPKLIDGSRRLRIANGSGVTTSEVNALLKQFDEMQKMMKGLGGKMLGRKGKKGKKGKKGGRVTPKGAAAHPPQAHAGKTALHAPGLELTARRGAPLKVAPAPRPLGRGHPSKTQRREAPWP